MYITKTLTAPLRMATTSSSDVVVAILDDDTEGGSALHLHVSEWDGGHSDLSQRPTFYSALSLGHLAALSSMQVLQI